MMMSLGMFVFQLSTVPFQEFQRQLGWRHPATGRVGVMPAHQFLGQDEETVSLNGVLLPEITGGWPDLAILEDMANRGKAWPLIDGTGIHYGLYVITSLNTTHSLFFPDGAARRIEFALTLKRIDDTATDMLAGYNDIQQSMP